MTELKVKRITGNYKKYKATKILEGKENAVVLLYMFDMTRF